MSQDDFSRARDAFLAGVAALEAGRAQQAEAAFEASLALVPGRASTLANLGAVRLRLGRPRDAAAVLRQAVAADAGDAQAWGHLGTAEAELGRPHEALACFDRALRIAPALAPAWLRRSQVLQGLDRYQESLADCDRALAQAPALADAWSHRGNLLKDMGRHEEAAAAFREALARGGDAELNGYFLASLAGGEAPVIAPAAYVQGLFDGYADDFEQHLVATLRYQAHEVLVRELQAAAPGRRFERALDLGCGTGLVGERIAPLAGAVHGVDLSAAMVAKAAARGVYAQVSQADLQAHLVQLAARAQHYDLVLSADVFIYIGELSGIFEGVKQVLLPGGLFAFSVELAPDTVDFELRASQRYAQSHRYLSGLARRHGFDVLREARAALREDQRVPVEGLFLVLRAR